MNFIRLFLGIMLVYPFFSCKEKEKERSSLPFVTAEINNPVLPGFYPDPGICKGPDGYYMVHSTFLYFPGIPVFHSPDLVHWKQVGHVLTRAEQLQIQGQNITSRGTYAPTIAYHDGKFYVTCTEVGGRGNYITTAEDPSGPWSDLHFLPEVQGIDPSLFFDSDGRTYIVYNSDPPDNVSHYDGHRTIRMSEIDINTMKVIGENRILVNGGVDITKKPVWIEGPHIYRVNDYYYLCAAEGGTSVNHSQVIFRSRDVAGPYEPWEDNPILTQKHLDPLRERPVTSTGHADLIEDLEGNWWAVFLACRPYEGNHYNLGRETFMAPVEWEDGWPRINPGHEEVRYTYPFASALPAPEGYKPLNGNFTRQEDFDSEPLGLDWMTIRSDARDWYRIIPGNGGQLRMEVRPFSEMLTGTPSFLGRRQQHLRGNVSALLSFSPERDEDKAGLIVFQNMGHFYFLCKSVEKGMETVQLYRGEGEGMTKLASSPLKEKGSLKLKIESDYNVYRCYYATEHGDWQPIGETLDARHLSTETAGGFTGCLYGMYALSSDDVSGLSASYNWFRYEGKD